MVQKYRTPAIIAFVFCTLVGFAPPWMETIENHVIDLQFLIRGPRDLSREIVLVYIGPEDIKSMGGSWPITRDYYGYMAHVLSRLGAKVIGFYTWFEAPDRRFPEYDKMMADLFRVTKNICLPMAFETLSQSAVRSGRSGDLRLLRGNNAGFPISALREHAAAIGFSNLNDHVIQRTTPLVVQANDSTLLSYGTALAKLFLDAKSHSVRDNMLILEQTVRGDVQIPLEESGQLLLNHFGGLANVQSIGFLDLLQSYETAQDSIHMQGKIVIVDVTAAGKVTSFEGTPFTASLPSSLVHATVAENIIQQNYLRRTPLIIDWLIIVVLVGIVWGSSQLVNDVRSTLLSLGALLVYLFLTAIVFRTLNTVLIFYYPVAAFAVTLALATYSRLSLQRSRQNTLSGMLRDEVIRKEKALSEAKLSLQQISNDLLAESNAALQVQAIAEERREQIFELEKRLRDLESYKTPFTPEATVGVFSLVHGKTSRMVEVLDLVSTVAKNDISVLLSGATGTGKELIASAIHSLSERKEAPFVAVNCGALPETLLDSELFGHEKGSFTDARSQRRGRFELADGGTIFLDEITETTPAFQARLLRVLQEGQVERLGGEGTISIDVRVISATNKNIKVQVDKGVFRSDLYYRLNGFPIVLPSLAERRDDIPLLVTHFLEKHDHRSVEGISEEAVELLRAYNWPGNVRELENIVRRAAILVQRQHRQLIQTQDLPAEIKKNEGVTTDYLSLQHQILESLRALRFSRSAISGTAKALGNRDRGTITEYFRGICFEELVNADYDVDSAVETIASSEDAETRERVKAKLCAYLANLYPLPEKEPKGTSRLTELPSQYRGLPKRYHGCLAQVIAHYREESVNE